MVERASLTPTLVDGLIPPTKGERWIADTKVRGFGLRMWTSRTGEPKMRYAIRVSDKSGKSHRKTLNSWRAEVLFRYMAGLSTVDTAHRGPTNGELLEAARNWARDEIAKIKGTSTLQDEIREQRASMKVAMASITLQRAANSILRSYNRAGLSQPYIDRLDKLFSMHVPEALKEKAICEISATEVQSLVDAPALSPGNLRVLRPFLGKIFSVSSELQGHPNVFWRAAKDSRYVASEPKMSGVAQAQPAIAFESIFADLESRNSDWQQALCLYLFLEFRSPLSRLMAARWDEIWDVTYRSTIHRREWRYANRRFAYEQFTRRTARVLDKVLELGRQTHEQSNFLFPSKFRMGPGHIRSIEHVWRDVLHKFRLPYLSPRRFRMKYHEHRLEWWLVDPDWRAFEPPAR